MMLQLRNLNVNQNATQIKNNKEHRQIRPLRLKDLHKMKRWDNKQLTWDYLADVGRFTDMQVRLGPFEGIKDVWLNEPAYIVGASANIKGWDLKKLEGLHTIGINHMIEYYGGFEWFIFLDNRFLQRTTYDITKFQGKVFSSNKCKLLPDNDNVRFKVKSFHSDVNLDITQGLFNASMTGLCALNLVLISGANPIYLLGCDEGGCDSQNFHFGDNYTGAIHTEKYHKKYIGAKKYYKAFSSFADRIVNVDKKGVIDVFKKIDLTEFEKRLPKIEVKQTPKICHVGVMDSIDVMGDITRQVYEKSYGIHSYCRIDDPLPKADIYLLECFLNGSEKFRNFKKPYNSKVISLIHSSGRCMPAICSDKVITITNAWQNVIKNKGYDSAMIHGAIDLKHYSLPDYSKKTFGRITRYSIGKVHPSWNNVVNDVLEKFDDAKCIMITDNDRLVLKHPRMITDTTIKINEHEKKAKRLSEMTIFCDAHNTFVETFSLCLLEAMASGLPCVMYSSVYQPAMIEILGGTGIICNSIGDFRQVIIELLPDRDRKMELGLNSRMRAKEFSIEKMIKQYDRLFKEVLK